MLINTLRKDQLEARKNKDKLKSTLLTTLIGEASMIGKNNGNRESTDKEVFDVIKKFIKNINTTIELVEDVNDLKTEKTILESYLPKQLTEEELDNIIVSAIKENNYDNIKQMGAIMKFLKDNYNGLYDGSTASKIIKEKF